MSERKSSSERDRAMQFLKINYDTMTARKGALRWTEQEVHQKEPIVSTLEASRANSIDLLQYSVKECAFLTEAICTLPNGNTLLYHSKADQISLFMLFKFLETLMRGRVMKEID
jgi:hypothetical protein